jgi:hypothetical protein
VSDPQGGFGQQDPFNSSSEFNSLTFLIQQILGTVRTMVLVRVEAVTNAGGVSAVGFVDASPLVNQLDGAGNAVPHATIYGLPYFRLQGGTDAIILDPKVGDIGFACIADRDSSVVKTTKAPANPGSMRKFSLADGVYIGGILNGIPQQYIQFSAAGITVRSPSKVTIIAPVTEAQGNFRATGSVIAGFGTGDEVNLQTHSHPTAPDGPPSSPTPGS